MAGAAGQGHAGFMPGTLICAVTDGDESDDALALGAELSERLGLRLVLAHAVDGIAGDGDIAEQRLARLACDHGVNHRADRRVAIGEPATLLGQIAAEEAADMIVVPAAVRGWRRRLDLRLAGRLGHETPVPVLIAPPRGGRERR